MNLNYSFHGIEPLWFEGDLPFPKMQTEKVKVNLTGRSSGEFPPFLHVGDLLTYRRDIPGSSLQSAVTLLLTYRHGTVPAGTTPPPMGEWYPTPGAPIWGQIRIALPPEVVKTISKVSGFSDHDYEITLQNVELIKVGPA